MSRTGFKKIQIPSGVEVKLTDGTFKVKGPKGELHAPIFANIDYSQEGDVIAITRSSEEKTVKAKHGLTRALLSNCIDGVSKGFQKDLQIIGVGYRANVQGKILNLNLGFSHEVKFPIPEGITIEVNENTKVSIAGIDKQQVGQVAAQIRSLRPPEPYKGKGVRYADEQIRRKAGKTGKK